MYKISHPKKKKKKEKKRKEKKADTTYPTIKMGN
jgi:hypothetical protein